MPFGSFIETLRYELSLLPNQYRTIELGNLIMNQLLEENINILQPLLTEFNLCQRSMYATNVEGGILDLVLDSAESNPVCWIPSPYSDHFVILINIR